jgi:hypothetical protein
MDAPAIIVGRQCRYCRKWYPKGDFVLFGPGLERCPKCQERHLIALDALAGNPPKECAFCHITFEKLSDKHPGERVPMVVHMIDGTYMLACQVCDIKITELTRHLFKGTMFGKARGIA